MKAGRTPRVNRNEGLTVHDLANRFLAAKKSRVATGELSNRSFLDYHATCARILDCFGKTRLVSDLASDDFEKLRSRLAETRGPVSLGNEITRIRVVFTFAYAERLIDKPVWYGQSFKKPSAKSLRIERAKKGPRMFSPGEVRAMLDAAPLQLRTMVLLAMNCGLGNHDCGRLTLDAVDLDRQWLEFPRPKTGVHRRCWLWEETVEALREVIAKRAEPKREQDAKLVFLTRLRMSWADDEKASPLSVECKKLLDKLGIYRPGLGFYALRHTYETVAGESRDQVAVDATIGHVDTSMAGVYREGIGDERRRAVAMFVHGWLWPRPLVLAEGRA